MINLAVINLKEFIASLFKLIFTILIICIICKLFGNIKKGNYTDIKELKMIPVLDYSQIINRSMLISEYYNKEKIKKESGIKKILVSEFAILGTEEELMEKENQEELKADDGRKDESNLIIEDEIGESVDVSNLENKSQIEAIPEKLPTEIIKINNKENKYTDIYKTVKIKNESKYPLTEEMLIPNVNFKNENIVIYHTHTCESYTPTVENKYESSGNYRTTDLNYSVARVGKELTLNLANLGYNVKQDMTYHDYPAYTGSYTRSLSTIKKVISEFDSEFIIDLHRDALGSDSKYAPSVRIGDEIAAQLMFVMGTDGGGLEHPNWVSNLKFAIKIQEKANEMYPGLFKPIILRNSRYNQHVSSSACILEVGATGNTLEQCMTSMKYLAKVIDEVMK